MKYLLQMNIIPKNRFYYAFLGLTLAALLFSATATTFMGIYSYIETYLGESDNVLILTEEGSGRTIATSYIDLQIAKSASYIHGVIVSSPETITPCIVNNRVFVVRGVEIDKFAQVDDYTIIKGRNLYSADLNGAILGYKVANKLGLAVNSKFILFSSLRDITIELVVVGIFKSSKSSLNDEIIVPLSLGQWISGHYPDKCTFVRIKFDTDNVSKSSLQSIIMRKHTLNLFVYDNNTNAPINGANIEIYNILGQKVFKKQTDSIGNINYELPIGNYTINISYNGIIKSRKIFLINNITLIFKLDINIEIYTLYINVFQDLIPVPEHTITIWHGSELVFMGQTNSSGTVWTRLPSCEYIVSTYYFSNISGSQIEYTQFINLYKNMTLNFLFRNYSLDIYTFDPVKNIFIDTIVEIKNIKGKIVRSGQTGEDGYIQFTQLPPDHYYINITAGMSKMSDSITLKSDLTLNYNILPYFILNISVMNYSSSQKIDANISITNLENNYTIYNSTGYLKYICYNLESGLYRITYEIDNYSESIIYNLNKNANLTFWTPPYNVSIFLKYYNGTSVSKANLTIKNNNQMINATTNSSGKVLLWLFKSIYNLTVHYNNRLFSTLLEVNDFYENLTYIVPPYNFTMVIFNGSKQENETISNVSIKIYEASTSMLVYNNITDGSGLISTLLDPNIYNISIHFNNRSYSKIIQIKESNFQTYFYIPPYNLTINITSAISALPISNASISVYKLPENQFICSANSSTDGIASVLLNESGNYNVSINYQGTSIYKNLQIHSDPIIDVMMPPYNVSILVIDANGPVKNANVSINSDMYNLTDDNGLTWFILDQGIYNISAKYGKLSKTSIIDLSGINPDTFIKLRISKLYTLDVNVVDSINGEPISNCVINIYLNGSLVETGETGISGRASFELGETENIFYNISVKYHNICQFRFLNLTSNTTINFSLIRTNLLIITTLNGDGIPLQYSKIFLTSTDGIFTRQLYTDENGNGIIYLDSGTYNLTITKNNFIRSIIFNIWDDKHLLFYFPPFRLTVHVFNSSNDYLPDINVKLMYKNGTLINESLTNSDGKAIFLINEGEYKVSLRYNNRIWEKELSLYNLNSSIELFFIVEKESSSKYAAASPSEYSSSLLEQTFGLTKAVIYILTIIITILVSLSIMNVVSASINESRRNIGIIKALGASNFQVFLVSGFKILIISIFAGIIGGFFGVILGGLISSSGFQLDLLDIYDFDSFINLMLFSIFITLIITIISSSYTLYKINKIMPAEALREIAESK